MSYKFFPRLRELVHPLLQKNAEGTYDLNQREYEGRKYKLNQLGSYTDPETNLPELLILISGDSMDKRGTVIRISDDELLPIAGTKVKISEDGTYTRFSSLAVKNPLSATAIAKYEQQHGFSLTDLRDIQSYLTDSKETEFSKK